MIYDTAFFCWGKIRLAKFLKLRKSLTDFFPMGIQTFNI